MTTTPELEDPASADGREAPAPPEFAAAQHFHGRVIRLVSLDRAMTTIGASAGGLLAAGIGAQSTQFLYGALTPGRWYRRARARPQAGRLSDAVTTHCAWQHRGPPLPGAPGALTERT
ncbi:MAG: hypothetical protein O3A10_03005 [Chloroflexi bacterium]|nr:hypothetical protein [Chloroflexota bacterium]MDA1145125.1 hypothetical protein [Chloroflexota bacterium]